MSATVTTLRLLWPFLKEMLLGDKTLSEAIKTNKMRVLLLFLILGSFAMNLFVVPRVFDISSQYVELEKEHKKLVDATKDVETLTADAQALRDELDKTKEGLVAIQKNLQTTKSNEKFLTDQLALCKSTKPNCPTAAPPVKNNRYEQYLKQLDRMNKEEVR